ncbi:MAG: hypothetical protein R3B48_02850 [Kofleriaceae bacterium]
MDVRGRTVGLLALAGLSLASGTARAQRVGVVAIPAPGAPASPAEVTRAGAALAGAKVAWVGDGLARARAARQAGAVPASRLAALQRVLDAGREAWRAYLQVAVPFAASRLGAARTDAEALLPLPGGLEIYADLSLRLGACLLALGRAEEAQDALALASALDPDREVSLVEFSPDVVDAASHARARGGELIELTIVTPGVRGAVLELDGHRVGDARPLPDRGGSERQRVSVPRGSHVVVARRRGYLDAAQAVRVDAPLEITLPLGRDEAGAALAAVAAGMSEEQATSLVEGVLVYGDVDEVLLVATSSRRGGATLLAQRCGANLRCTAVVEIAFAARELAPAMRRAWAAVARGELRYPASLPSDGRLAPAPVISDRPCRVCRSPWLWGGVGVALAVTSAVLVLTLGQDDPPPVLTVDPGDF